MFVVFLLRIIFFVVVVVVLALLLYIFSSVSLQSTRISVLLLFPLLLLTRKGRAKIKGELK